MRSSRCAVPRCGCVRGSETQDLSRSSGKKYPTHTGQWQQSGRCWVQTCCIIVSTIYVRLHIKYIISMRVSTSGAAVLTLIVFAISACNSMSGKSFLPAVDGYHEKSKEVFILKKKLLEVSGIAYLENDSMAAINDEKG